MDRDGMADFLRSRRARLVPSDVGLAPGVRRRTPGLRRDEVALLASMSSDYYTRLEQARGPRPSLQILSGLSRALRLSDDEHDHLLHLAGYAAPVRRQADGHVGAGLMHVLDRLVDIPATVLSDLGEVVVQNAMARAVLGDYSELRGRDGSVIWRWFAEPSVRERFPSEDWPLHERAHVADLRATYGRRRGDADVESLVADLLDTCPEFRELWARHDVAVRRTDVKRVLHPEVGLIDLQCEVLLGVDGGHTLAVLYPRPGTNARELLDLVAVIGTQTVAAPPPR